MCRERWAGEWVGEVCSGRCVGEVCRGRCVVGGV